jgi:hypothetical protein
MPDVYLEGLKPSAAEKIRPFLDEVISRFEHNLHSIQVTGTAVTDDYDEKVSDVNSIFVLKEMDLKLLELLAPLGKKYGKKRVAAPLIMTPEYIRESLDVFPIEFMNSKLVHSTVYGADIFNDIEIDLKDLRHQCEREIKTKLIWLRQGYISSQGDRKLLAEGLTGSITAYIPLFRGIIALLGKEPPVIQKDVLASLAQATNVDTGVFARVLREKHERKKQSLEELNTQFEDYYYATEKLRKTIDEI